MFSEDLDRPIWRIPLGEFLGPAEVRADLWVEHDGFCTVQERSVDMPSMASVEHLTDHAVEPGGDYRIARLKNGRDVVLLFDDGSGDLEPVGQYTGDSLNIVPAHRGLGLSAPLILAAAEARGGTPEAREYTPPGHAAHRAAHRFVVAWAVEQGLEVPDEVLSDYPGLRTAKPTP
jgi:hypothetical protein